MIRSPRVPRSLPPHRGHGGRTIRPSVVLLFAASALALALLRHDDLSRSPRVAGIAVTVTAASTIFALARLRGGRALSLGLVYFLVFSLFHGGLAPYLALGTIPQVVEETDPGPLAWYRSPHLADATALVMVSMLAYLLGYSLLCAFRWWRAGETSPAEESTTAESRGMHLIGTVLLAAGGALLFSVLLQRGIASFATESYGSFYDTAYQQRLAFAFLFTGVGLTILGTSGRTSTRRRAVLLFAPFATIAFVAGFRGAVIFPGAAFLVALARRRQFSIGPWLPVAFLLTLAAGAIVRQARRTGLANADLNTMRINPLDGVAELGATLRTVVMAHEWHLAWREPFAGWGTYLASVERLVLGRGLDYDVLPAAMDPRVFTALAKARSGSGGIGGSPTAEAFHAAGLVGVLVVMTLIGILVAWLDARPSGSLTEYLVGMLGYVLLVWSRNDVAPVPAQVGICFAILLLARLFDTIARSRSPGPPTPDGFAVPAGRAGS